MANDITRRTWILDSNGMLTTTPVIISHVKLFPNAVSDVANLKTYNWNSTKSTTVQGTVTVSTNATIACTGAFTTAKVAVGDAIKISYTSTGNNLGTYLVKTRTNDDTIVIDDGGLTNEDSKVYNFEIHTGTTEIPLRVSEDSLIADEFVPASPIICDNLALDDLSTSAKVYVYIL